jgi:hypothetical protein
MSLWAMYVRKGELAEDKISSIDNGMVTVIGTVALSNKSYVLMHNGGIFSTFKKMLRSITPGKRKE